MIQDVQDSAALPSLLRSPKRSVPRDRKRLNLTPADEARVRTCYLVRGLSPKDCEAETGVSAKVIYSLAHNRGWAAARRAAWGEADKASEAALSRDVNRVMQTIAADSEEITVGALQMARDALTDKDAKSLSMSSTAIRNLVEVARRIRALDQEQTQRAVISFTTWVRPTINVTPNPPIECATSLKGVAAQSGDQPVSPP
jgi:hypothetical protein